MLLPFPGRAFDSTVMALVIFFVRDPAKAVAEMARVVRPGGLVSAYAWDMMNGGSPFEIMQLEMAERGVALTIPPNAPASRIDALRQLWEGAGLESVATTDYAVHRTFDSFEELWATNSQTASVALKFKALDPTAVDLLRSRMRDRYPADATGRVTSQARVTAVKGRVPK